MYKKYNIQYQQVMETLIESTVKNTAVEFTTDEFRLNRSLVESKFEKSLRYILSGKCDIHTFKKAF